MGDFTGRQGTVPSSHRSVQFNTAKDGQPKRHAPRRKAGNAVGQSARQSQKLMGSFKRCFDWFFKMLISVISCFIQRDVSFQIVSLKKDFEHLTFHFIEEPSHTGTSHKKISTWERLHNANHSTEPADS